jgi:tetratricopeptide (TPR) repeat protein
MKNTFETRSWTSVVMIGAVVLAPLAFPLSAHARLQAVAPAQAAATKVVPAATQALLDKAHALEVRGRVDMAGQTWQQVLLADPNNTEALGGLARAYKLEGKPDVAETYIQRLKLVNPNDPGIARAQNMGTQSDHNSELAQAGKLAQQGQYGEAMAAYRKLYGDTPPPGDIALAYYETEAATEDGRPHAIAGLRSMVAKNPGDSRSQVVLGRILTYNPKTRAEGRRILQGHPGDPQAVEAYRQSLLWDAQNPATAGDIRDYLSKHPDAQLEQALRSLPKNAGGPVKTGRQRSSAPPMTAEQKAVAAANAGRNAEESAAYRDLNAKRLPEAEQKFKAILAKTPDNANALAGMGYIRMQQANFGGAISFLAQAKQDGSKDPGIESALQTSRFWYTMAEGAASLTENDLPTAEKNYRLALGMRPQSIEALEGLGGTLLKAQQSEAAIPYFVQFVKLKPTAPHAWRGLFLAQFGSGAAPQALATEKAMPPAVRAELYKDPLYLRALSSAYTSVGNDGDAQKVIRMALDLPFPADARGLEAETQLQYAGLLQAANHLEQAQGLYRQVLAKDPNNTDAWQGLIRAQHGLNQDEQALQSLETMPPASYAKAMREPGFDATVAGLYETQKRYDVAQEILEKTLAQQASIGQKPAVSTRLQLAGVYMERNNPAQAYPLYSQLLTESPDRTEAWKGLFTALHNSGRDTEALAEIQQVPPATRALLENDVDFLQTMGGVYASLGQPAQAQQFLRRVQQHYATEHAQAPADVDIQNAWLLYNGGNDAALHRQLLTLGGRNDLNDTQRRTIQTIWANWAVRRANQAAAAGDPKRSMAILNATARAFPDNPGVIKALAGGYARSGMPKQAVLIWKAQDLKTASASDYKAAVGAALAAGDQKAAETWLRFALDQYPHDADLLNLGARFEAARGDTNRAIDYYKAAVDAMPAPDPGAELANELGRPVPMTAAQLPSSAYGQGLAALLAPSANDRPSLPSADDAPVQPMNTQPYLPSYMGVGAPVQMYATPAYATPSQMAAPTPDATTIPSAPRNPSAKKSKPLTTSPRTRLRDYVPQASLEQVLPSSAGRFSESVGATYSGLSGPVLRFASYRQQQGSTLQQKSLPLTQQPTGQQSGAPVPLTTQPQKTQNSAIKQLPLTQQSVFPNGTQNLPSTQQQPATQQTQPVVDPVTGEVYGPFVPYTPTTVQLGSTPAAGREAVKPEVTDILPTARYVPNAKSNSRTSSHPDVNAANAEAIRRHQSDPPMTGESRPPSEVIETAPTEGVQYSGQSGTGQAGNGQVAQPAAAQTRTTRQQQQQTNQQTTFPALAQQPGDSYGQQYPQPNTGRTTPYRGRPRARVSQPAPVVEQLAPPPVQPVQPGLSYPGIGQSLSYQPYPSIGPAFPLGPAPTDLDLQARHLPPLRGSYIYDGTPLSPQVPLTPRQQTQRDLQTLESSYSGWLGGTASARYRSGTVGIDRLTDLEGSVEASVTLANRLRFTIVPKAVFLNSGTIDTGAYQGLAGAGVPVIGTFTANAINAPSEQNASGVGGELQVAGRSFAVAVGYTPYEFLIRNFTGRAIVKLGQNFSLYVNRDSVTETQLSYAGLRDPGQGSGVVAGPIWGGVMNTGGGIRFDKGDEKAGFYITADGSDLTGYHVLENTKFEGSMGAYFLAHTFPGYGKVNIGASLFGMHFSNNERGLSYGLGGYFSPDAYFLASVPVTFTGHYGNDFHYTIAGNVGVQTFQESSQSLFPLDRNAQVGYQTANCTNAQVAARTCGFLPVNSNTGANYGFNSEGAYRITEHWFGGGFISANNTNNYNTVTGGFFIRYLFRPQGSTEDYPTGLFPVEGFRPLRVP